MGRMISFPRTRTRAERTRPSFPSFTSNTLPTGHWLRASWCSSTSTRSPSRTFLWGSCHLVRWRSKGRYSFVHRLQKMFARYSTLCHLLLRFRSSSLKSPGRAVTGRCMRRWFGVRGSRSRGSLETGVIGQLLMIPSAPTSRVVSISWERTCSRVSLARTFLTIRICCS